MKKADITYAELAERYNAAIEPLSTLWSRADIDIAWAEVNEDGERRVRSESGSGKFIMRRGNNLDDTAMTVEKLGKIYLWAGSNQEYYYLFDRVDGDDKKLYIGRYARNLEDLQRPARPFPLPIHPRSATVLLGFAPLPALGLFPDEGVTIDLYRDQYLLNHPELGLRILIDPQTFRPSRVDLLDEDGFSRLTAKLSGSLEVEADPLLSSPLLICDKAEVFVSGYESRFTLDFQSATASPRRVKDQMFDLEVLKKALNADRVIDLDAP